MAENDLFGPAAAARLLGLRRIDIDNHAARGRLAYLTDEHRRRLFLRSSLERFAAFKGIPLDWDALDQLRRPVRLAR